MISDKLFRDSWALLCDRFSKQPSTPLMLAYYKTLSPQMSDEQFKAAAQRIFVEREFFPRPADFLDGVRVDPRAEALEQWEQVHELMRGFPVREKLTEEAKRCIRMLGGEHKLRNTDLDAVQYVRRDFLELYADAADIARREAGNRIAPTAEGLRLTDEIMAAARDAKVLPLQRAVGNDG